MVRFLGMEKVVSCKYWMHFWLRQSVLVTELITNNI